jgi:hypothetical protein
MDDTTVRTIVLRVEDKAGYGVFRGADQHYNSLMRTVMNKVGHLIHPQEDPYRHPGPDDCHVLRDLDICTGSRWYFGFSRTQDLFAWFDCGITREAMHKAGARLVTYEVDHADVHYGSIQLVFDKSRARVVSSVPMPF